MITAGKVSETLVLDGIKWGMGILLVLLYGSVHSQLEQYNPIIIYTSLILYILLFLADFIPSYRHKEKTDIQFKLFLYIGSLCLFFILVFLLKAPQYTASHTPFIISFCFFSDHQIFFKIPKLFHYDRTTKITDIKTAFKREKAGLCADVFFL